MTTTALPTLPSKIGNRGQYTMPDGSTEYFTIIDEITRPSTQPPLDCVYCLQKLKYDGGAEEIRLAYYIIGVKPGMQGKWVFGQYSTSMDKADFKYLVEEAQKRNWF